MKGQIVAQMGLKLIEWHCRRWRRVSALLPSRRSQAGSMRLMCLSKMVLPQPLGPLVLLGSRVCL